MKFGHSKTVPQFRHFTNEGYELERAKMNSCNVARRFNHFFGSKQDVSIFWGEKLLFLIQMAQLFALIWTYATNWPWPWLWAYRSQWMLWFNFDIPSYNSLDTVVAFPANRNSVFGTHSDYWIIAAAWAGLPVVLGFTFWCIKLLSWMLFWEARATKWASEEALLVLAQV
jgi:hypothetical protein